MIFETERLFIRKLEENDSEAMFEIYSDKEAMKFRSNKPFENVVEAIEMIKHTETEFQLGLKFRYAIIKKETNELIGTILYFSEYPNSDCCTIGYSLGRNFWKQGFAFEIVIGFISYLKMLNFKELHAKVFKMNTDSIHLLNKTGFELIEENNEKYYTFKKNI